MKRARTSLTAALAVVAVAVSAPAQVPDHLKCYKVKDPQAKATYTADLGGLVEEPGCTIKVPAIMACVPATKTNVTPTPPGGGGTGTPNAFGCYKIKCPKATLPALQLNDQFGSRLVTPSTPKLLCAPVAPTTTTTTTTAASTTTTTMGPTTHTVEVGVALRYSPSTLMIHTGDTVTWIFETSAHTVTSGTNCVASPNGPLNGSATFSFTFTTPGVFPYFCAVDSHCQLGETGSVTVQ